MLWFKHDADASQDAKLQNVLLDYGLEGYGLYWYCIELIVGKIDVDNITFELEHDARIIARNVGSTAQKVEEMMRYFVKNGLFESTDRGRVTCLKIARRLDKSMTSNPKMRDLIEKVRSVDYGKKPSHPDGVMTSPDKVMQDEMRSDKSREDDLKDIAAVPAESKTNKSSKAFQPPTYQQVDLYMREVNRGSLLEAHKFVDHFLANGWKVGGKTPMKDWKAAVRNWLRNIEGGFNHGVKTNIGNSTGDKFENWNTGASAQLRENIARLEQGCAGGDGEFISGSEDVRS